MNATNMKNLIDWTDDLSVGIQEIDEQHRILVGLLNRLYQAIITRTDNSVMNEILRELTEYTVVHFAVEESLMRIFDYPDYDEHKQHHQELTQQVFELKNKVKSGKTSVSMEVLNFLRHWLTNHIQMEDKRYAPFFLARGLKKSWSNRSWVDKMWNYVHHK